MSNSKPVGYLTLKCLLKHLDSGLRLQLSIVCPSIRNLEKSFPLHIKCLKLTDNSVTVNKSTFRLNFVNNGVQFDICGQKIQELETQIEKLFNNITSLHAHVDNRELTKLLEEQDRIHRSTSSVNYIRLGSRNAFGYLLEKLFEGRDLKIEQIAISCKANPSKLKFQVKSLKVYSNSTLDSVSLFIEESSLPVSSVKLRIPTSSHNYTHPIVQTATVLEIPGRRHRKYIMTGAMNRKRVHVTHLEQWTSYNLKEVVLDWMKNSRAVGIFHTFEIAEEVIDETMRSIRRTYEFWIIWSKSRHANKMTMYIRHNLNLVISKDQYENQWVLGLKMENWNF